MSQTIRQLALPLETHRNHFLFSDYYLNELLPRQTVRREVEAEAQEALEAITRLYDQKAGLLPHYNESQTEEHWIRPVLDILGHVYEVQPPLPGALGTPDYAFFADEEARQSAAPTLGKAGYWETVLAVGDAKRWERPLDKRIVDGAPDAFTNANPCYQIDYYLRRTGCAWGVVSNGRRWRLYHRDTSFRLDVFYEVDLVQLIEQGKLDAFRYFYLFFHVAAFHPDAEEPALSLPKGRCWLDEVLAQSAAYAVRVGDELKERVYEALRLLAQGFLDYSTNQVFSGKPGLCLDPATDLSRLHDGCLILLYRLLFLLYAESRGLLPLDNPGYAGQYSLKAIKEDIAHKLDVGVVYLEKKATIWDDLRTLFDIIYSGQETLGVPAYDGRLFDPARYPFLEEHTIGDRYLAQAIDLLARAGAVLVGARSPRPHLSFVDYRDLSIRHLGSIYEGLLEYKLAYAAEEMVVVRRGKKEEIVPSSKAGEGKVVERIPAGQAYLVTDRGERKATGSYYTPGYIVKYIVEQTLGPLTDAQAEAVEREIAALKAKNRGSARRTQAYKETLVRLQNSFADRVLTLNVLDPAMGSGHFLVETTDYLARRIVEAGVVTPALLDGDEESELSYWRRWVVERCIYGVDLNPLAVELAKLSLWLATVARGKPLSFLDHHLRCGNSLIGARVADLQSLPVRKKRRKKEAEVQQLAMWDESAFTQDMYLVVGAMRQIQEYETADLVSVKEKERLFEETVERERRKWRAVADLWTATYFGLELTPELYNACAQHIQGQPVLLQAAQAEAYLTQAHEIWEDKCFFHWEIEFPEVFFDEYGQHKGEAAGFDAVVGNPPYVKATDDPEFQLLKKQLKQLGSSVQVRGKMMYETLHLKWDLYIPFLEQAYNLLATRGQMGFIIPDSYAITPYAAKSRTLLATQTTIQRIDHFPDIFLFPGVSVHNLIVVCKRTPPGPEHVPGRRLHTDENDVSQYVGLPPVTQAESPWTVFSPLQVIVRFDPRRTIALGRLCYVNKGGTLQSHDIKFRGLFRKASLLSDVKDATHPKPYVEGKDVGRGFIETVRYLEYGEGTRNPAMVMEPRFPEMFENEKLLFGKTSGVYWDRDSLWCDQSARVAVPFYGFSGREARSVREQLQQGEIELSKHYALGYLFAVCQSRLVAYHLATFSTDVRDRTPETIKSIPIRRIEFTTPPEERERLVGEGLKHEEREMARMARNTQDTFEPFADFRPFRDSDLGRWVGARLSAEPEQSDVVHDLLAHLAEQMIEMHEAKQAEVRGFLDWLAKYTGRPVDDWALKTNLRRYYEHDWAEMQRVLKRNQRKLPGVNLDVDAYKNAPAAKIRAAWETSMDTLRPLLARIKATDRLIDLIAYRLYGLTEEEVAVVEGRLKHE